jgi:excisionase family DNA binding protein
MSNRGDMQNMNGGGATAADETTTADGAVGDGAMGEWLTVREAAEVTGISVGRIYTLINNHKVRAELKKVGTRGACVLVVRAREVTTAEESRRAGRK